MTADDYTWFRVLFPDLARAYSLTLVRGVPAADLLDRLGVHDQIRTITGAGALTNAAYSAQVPGESSFMSAADAGGGWTVAVEPNGFAGVTPGRLLPVSAGTRIVSHFRNINALDTFCWFEDSSVRLRFEPGDPRHQTGTEAYAHLALMKQVGFVLDEDDDEYDGMELEAAFALAEQLTGVRVTPDLIDATPYLCATIPVP